MSVSEKVKLRINRMQRGTPFAIRGFYSLGSTTSVQKALSRLAKEGTIERVSKGFYVRPKPLASTPSIKTTTSAEQVARAWAKKHNYKLVHQGLEAAYRLGLQTQAPIKKIFWTNGPSRTFKIGHDVVEVRHITDTKLRWASQPEGALLRSMAVTSPQFVEWSNLQNAFNRLSLSESEAQYVVTKLSKAALPNGWNKKLAQFEQALD
ncbi:MAG: DUF6088 family protein [Pseudomonadales bacterium]